MTDSDFRAAVTAALEYPGRVFAIDGGLAVKAWPSYESAIVIPDYFAGGSMYRVAVVIDDASSVMLGAETLDGVRILIRAVALANVGRRVLVAIYDPVRCEWLNADGTACKEQDSGPQYRDVEVRVMVGSVAVV